MRVTQRGIDLTSDLADVYVFVTKEEATLLRNRLTDTIDRMTPGVPTCFGLRESTTQPRATIPPDAPSDPGDTRLHWANKRLKALEDAVAGLETNHTVVRILSREVARLREHIPDF